MDFEDILLDVGDRGRYQKGLILIFLIPSATLLPWFTMNVFFMVSVPDHWCNVPEVAESNLTIEQQRMLISPSTDPKCYMYNINYTDYLSSGIYDVPNDTTTRPCNNGWQHDKTNYESTAATKWNMFCEDGHYTSFVLTMYHVGSIIGTPIYGALSDKIGRKITFFIVLIVTAVTAIGSVLMTDFTAFVVIKSINGSLMPSIFQLPYIIVLELVAPEMRTHMNGLVNCAWTVGLSLLPLIAYLTRGFVTLGLVTSSVTLVFFLYWKYLPESPRWLVSQERYDEALVIMKKIGDTNGKAPDADTLLSQLKTLGEKIKKEKTVDKVENSSMDLLRYPQLRKTFIIISFCWIADVMAYYGLQLNVTNLAGNEFFNFFLTAIVEIPGYLTAWILMDRYGRRWVTAAGFLLTGVVCMLPAFVSGYPNADIICSMMGKFCASATFMATYQQSSELYPTVVRSLGMGMSSTVSMTISLAVPYLVYLSIYGKAIPFVAIGSVAILAGILASFLPETLNENLPQTIFDCEEFGKRQKYFSWNRRRRSLSRERAASLALQLKGLEALGISDGIKEKKNSKILQNSDFIPDRKESVTSNEIDKKVNGNICHDDMRSSFKENDTRSSFEHTNNIANKDLKNGTKDKDEACDNKETFPNTYEQDIEIDVGDDNSKTVAKKYTENKNEILPENKDDVFDKKNCPNTVEHEMKELNDTNSENITKSFERDSTSTNFSYVNASFSDKDSETAHYTAENGERVDQNTGTNAGNGESSGK